MRCAPSSTGGADAEDADAEDADADAEGAGIEARARRRWVGDGMARAGSCGVLRRRRGITPRTVRAR
jgi:hypothetical protein